MHRVLKLVPVLAAVVAVPLRAQDSAALCGTVPAPYAERCIAAAQTASAVQPALGVLLAGSGAPPVDGALRFGLVTAAVRLSAVPIAFPDILEENDLEPPPPVGGRRRLNTVAVAVDAAAVLVPGTAGFGPIEALAGAGYLPFDLISREAYPTGGAQLSWTVGARVGVLGGSALLPTVSVSHQYRRIGTLSVGNACEGSIGPASGFTEQACSGAGDVAEAIFDASSWNTRVRIERGVGPLSVGGVVGHDRHRGELNVIVRGVRTAIGGARAHLLHQRGPVPLRTSRWSGFLDAALPVEFATLVASAGWMQGGERVAGFGTEGAFDPEAAAIHVSFGARFSF
jgi:hypothetical protein